jgi:hypothetical protein
MLVLFASGSDGGAQVDSMVVVAGWIVRAGTGCRVYEGVLEAWAKGHVSVLCQTSDGGGCGRRLPSWRYNSIVARTPLS